MAVRPESVLRGGALLETMLALFVVMVSMLALSSVQLRALLHGRDALLRAEAVAAALELGEAALLWPETEEEQAAAQRQADWSRLRQRLQGLGGNAIEARQCRGALNAMTELCEQQGDVVYVRLTWNDRAGGDGAGRFARRYALALEAP
ncbi:hypothetical protein HA052_12865 [Chromobacterium haemolyticum]|uniref:Type IV pilus assembly protein PilV n=1 Tax=Chromobacterium fluminis TaxID=3044269 RepID=A0ABX0L9B7_9NEIS|nr:hypothetical protein [Chromobacterium haemolyticum]NHR06089.1 hypothetical protein [Chromobacterium haemolyticum]